MIPSLYHVIGTVIVSPNSQLRTPHCIPVAPLPAPGGQVDRSAATGALALAMGNTLNFPICSDHCLQPCCKMCPVFVLLGARKHTPEGVLFPFPLRLLSQEAEGTCVGESRGNRFGERKIQQETIDFLRSITKVITRTLPVTKCNSTSAKREESFDCLPLNTRSCCKRPLLVTTP